MNLSTAKLLLLYLLLGAELVIISFESCWRLVAVFNVATKVLTHQLKCAFTPSCNSSVLVFNSLVDQADPDQPHSISLETHIQYCHFLHLQVTL
jgi:hypothetical protein